MRTLRDGYDYLEALEESAPGMLERNEWHNAGAKLMAAAEGGSVAEARDALHNALIISLKLWNPINEKKPRHPGRSRSSGA